MSVVIGELVQLHFSSAVSCFQILGGTASNRLAQDTMPTQHGQKSSYMLVSAQSALRLLNVTLRLLNVTLRLLKCNTEITECTTEITECTTEITECNTEITECNTETILQSTKNA